MEVGLHVAKVRWKSVRFSFLALSRRSAALVGDHLLALIDDLLQLGGVEMGKDEVELDTVSLPEIVSEAQDLVKTMAQSREISVESAIPAAMPVVVGEKRRLRQILVNLLSNAIKFTPVGGDVGVQAKVHPTSIELNVWDTGRGIAASDLDRIFEPFEQAGESVTGDDGNGLGLTLTKRLVELHKGTVSVESSVGQGSTFTVLLPREGSETPRT